MRSLLEYTAVFLLPLSTAVTGHPSGGSHCRCRPHEHCWPSEHDWNALNRSTEGNLVAVKPVGNVCHDPSFNEVACKDVTSTYTNSVWRAGQPGAMQFPNWEAWPEKNESCYIDTPRGVPCGQGRVSLYSVIAHSSKHIQTAVRFADAHNLRLVIKNSGHDFLGRSSAPDSLQILTHNMADIKLVDDFVPVGAKRGEGEGPAVTIGAGVYLSQLYKALGDKGRTAVLGLSHTVGAAGGYIQGGGHSPLGPWKGMACDNALEFEVVTAHGDIVTANAHQNKDLFWALRGGGGGTFGVVTKVTIRTYPDAPLVGTTFNISVTPSNGSFWEGVEQFHAKLPEINDAGGSGYYFMVPDQTLPDGSQMSLLIGLIFFMNQTDVSRVDKLFDPLLSSLRSIPGVQAPYLSFPAPNIAATFPLTLPGDFDGTGYINAIGSRLISRDFISSQSGPKKLVRALSQIKADGDPTIIGHIVAGGQVAKNQDIDSALNPAWRKAITHFVVGRSWPTSASPEDQKAVWDKITNFDVRLLKALEPDMGAYQNEADAYEKDFQQSFWGDNYGRLLHIKKKWDPKELFIVRSGVGSENWDDAGLCRKH